MINFKAMRVRALLASLLMSTGVFAATTRSDVEQALSRDGLQKVNVAGVDLAYARPGFTLAAYRRVRLDPVEVAFSKSWDPKRTGSLFRLSAEERESIRSGLVTIVQEEFVNELQRERAPRPAATSAVSRGDMSSYRVVDQAGPDVLRVRARVVDVYVNAPDTQSAGRSRTYTASAGQATLHLELVDSESGQVLARMVDRREARGLVPGSLSLSNRVVNAGEARDLASVWARILRDSLDSAHGIGQP